MVNGQEIIVQNTYSVPPLRLRAKICSTFFCRFRGLMFQRKLPPKWGLLLAYERENRWDLAIHMFGMWFDLAVVWINAGGEVVDARPAHRWRSVLVPRKPAKYVLETKLEYLEAFHVGDVIQFENANRP